MLALYVRVALPGTLLRLEETHCRLSHKGSLI
jgi:hypothetical protein